MQFLDEVVTSYLRLHVFLSVKIYDTT